MKGEVEMSIEKEEEEEEEEGGVPYYWSGPKSYYEIGVVRIGDRIIETTTSDYHFVVKKWLRYIDRNYRKRRGPLVAGLAVFRGLPRPPCWSWRKPSGSPSNPNSPIRAIALCLGGSHCLLYQDDGYYDFRTPQGLNDFLSNRNLAVVGIGVKRDAERLAAEWGIHVAHPVELRTLAARAFGEEQVWKANLVRGRIMIKGLGLEKLAELVLDGMKVGTKPARVVEKDWGEETQNEHIMYATRDAFLCFEIGLRCLKKIGHRT
ncbi:putative Werner Syndrome-like exonuclease [Cocos nucifera]|uniref:Putative Werner Syndrome-like exonuclease n=1 Tax=Cocos nucifera TaxID=13894 RepID=A0A8K0IU16_COCNU|nr:putative Werner Syndrome-like exonuclease [Cocos nucifera]